MGGIMQNSAVRWLIGIALGAVATIFIWTLLPSHAQAVNRVQLQYRTHCSLSNDDTLRLTATQAIAASATTTTEAVTVGQIVNVIEGASGACKLSGLTGGATGGSLSGFVNESGEAMTVAAAADGDATITGGKWTKPLKPATRFQSINLLLTDINPLLMVLAGLSLGLMMAVKYGNSGALQSVFSSEVYALIGAIIISFFLPTTLTALATANDITIGNLIITDRFGTLIDIIFGLVVLLFNVGLLGSSAWSIKGGAQTIMGGARQLRGRLSSGSGMG